MTDTLALERQEAEVALAAREPGDSISVAVGSNIYSTHHRFDDLRMDTFRSMSVSSSSLTVSRFYFGPKIVVDVIERPERFQPEITAKRAYCSSHGLRYVLVKDEYDEDGVRAQLTPARAERVGVVQKPRTAKPRTRRKLP